jgi:hypothetical protein
VGKNEWLMVHSMEAMINVSQKEVLPDFVGAGDNLGLLDKLAYLVGYGSMFVAVISEKKDNPFTLIKYLEGALHNANPTSTITSEVNHPDQLLGMLTRDFGLDQQRSPSIQNLKRYATSLIPHGRKPVLIVLDAHKIKDKVLKTLFSIAEKCELGLLVFARPSFIKRKVFRLFQSNIYVCPLARMNDVDLRSYIRRHNEDEVQVSNAQIEEILHRSEGAAGEVDRIVDDLLLPSKTRMGIPMMHMSVFVIMVLLGITFMGKDFIINQKTG